MPVTQPQSVASDAWGIVSDEHSDLGNHSTPLPPDSDISEHRLLAPVDAWPELPAPLYAAMLAIWHAVPSLQRRFPLHKGKPFDALGLSSWCVADGRRQYAILREIPAWDKALTAPIDLFESANEWTGTWSVAMFLYGIAKHQYTSTAWIHRATAGSRVAVAWWRGARHERRAPTPEPWQYIALVQAFSTWERFITALRLPIDTEKSTEQLVVEFGLEDVRPWFRDGLIKAPTERPPAVSFCKELRRGFTHVPVRLLRFIARVKTRLRSRPNESELASVMKKVTIQSPKPVHSKYPFGVNLYGYAFGEIGIGEDVRYAAEALRSQGIPFCVVNVQPGKNVSQLDTSIARFVVDAPKYAINLFCVTGKEHVRLVCEQGLSSLSGRYTIGMWPWELPRWPVSCRYAYAVVDELWGISHYTAAAYTDAPCPVFPMTLPVSIDSIGTETRADFGLPEDTYLFVFSFDFNSTASRKNPQAVIAAFQAAFPATGTARVGLVIKASHTNSQQAGWGHLLQLAARDPRIHLIGATLRRPSVLALYNCCDCYVSLHRAEGFGRGIAEALLLGKSIVTTGYSGNMDFCEERRVGLVEYRLIPLAPNDYFHGDGQSWADPDLVHAAQRLREAYASAAVAGSPVDLSPAVVGQRYARRLFALQSNHVSPSTCVSASDIGSTLKTPPTH